jgi:hypothetical protein
MATKKINLRFDDYVKGIERLRPDEQLRLIEIMSSRLKTSCKRPGSRHSVMELEGLGAQLWKEIDAQQYVNKERESWD